MYLITLVKIMVPGTKMIVYNELGNLIYAGTVEGSYGQVIAFYGSCRIKHFGPCYNKDDGSYLSITLKS